MLLTLDSAVTDRLRAAQEDYHRSRVIGQHDKTLLYQELWHQFDEVELTAFSTESIPSDDGTG